MNSKELVTAVLEMVLNVDRENLDPSNNLESLGWDSVQALRAMVYLERETGKTFDAEKFWRAESVLALAEILDSSALVSA